MARRVVLSDDMDGKEDPTVASRTFALGGTYYEIDLSDSNYANLEKALMPFAIKARQVSQLRARSIAGDGTPVDGNAAAREWARQQKNADGTPKYDVSERGRLPKEILDDYSAYVEASKGNGGDKAPAAKK